MYAGPYYNMAWSGLLPILVLTLAYRALHPDKVVSQTPLSVHLPVADLTHNGGFLAQSDLVHLLSWQVPQSCLSGPQLFQFLLLGAKMQPCQVQLQS